MAPVGNPIAGLERYGQSIWLDFIRRSMIPGGDLARLVTDDGVVGVTSNPSIFEKAIDGSDDYAAAIQDISDRQPGLSAKAIYEQLAIADIQAAADVLRPVYDRTASRDGYVSLEVSPDLANDTNGTLTEARQLWNDVARPNVMIKVPATVEGIRAVEVLTADGINVNITLMFSLEHYEAVAQAYLRGIDRHPNPRRVVSVASVFVSRLDLIADRQLEAIGSPEALALRGRIAIANARRIYGRFREMFDGEAFAALKRRGVRRQRPLWASTGTKNPSYSDVLYVEALVGPDTITTIPPGTVDAFRDHGRVQMTLGTNVESAEAALESAAVLGLDLHAMTEQLQADALKAFTSSFDQLLATLAEKRRQIATVAS